MKWIFSIGIIGIFFFASCRNKDSAELLRLEQRSTEWTKILYESPFQNKDVFYTDAQTDHERTYEYSHFEPVIRYQKQDNIIHGNAELGCFFATPKALLETKDSMLFTLTPLHKIYFDSPNFRPWFNLEKDSSIQLLSKNANNGYTCNGKIKYRNKSNGQSWISYFEKVQP